MKSPRWNDIPKLRAVCFALTTLAVAFATTGACAAETPDAAGAPVPSISVAQVDLRPPLTATEKADGKEASVSASPTFDWMVGVAALNTPTYLGADAREWKARPLWWVRYGRLSFAGPRASIGRAVVDEGVSAAGAHYALFDTDHWRFNLGLRLDSGRRSSANPQLEGLPDVKRRFVYSLNARNALSKHWSWSAALASDVRSTETGTTVATALNYTTLLAPGWHINASVTATVADRHYMEAFHGVDRVPAGSTLTAFAPRAGLHDVGLSVAVRHRIAERMTGFGSINTQRLMGDAGRSPLTTARQQTSVLFGVSYSTERAN